MFWIHPMLSPSDSMSVAKVCRVCMRGRYSTPALSSKRPLPDDFANVVRVEGMTGVVQEHIRGLPGSFFLLVSQGLHHRWEQVDIPDRFLGLGSSFLTVDQGLTNASNPTVQIYVVPLQGSQLPEPKAGEEERDHAVPVMRIHGIDNLVSLLEGQRMNGGIVRPEIVHLQQDIVFYDAFLERHRKHRPHGDQDVVGPLGGIEMTTQN